MRGPSISRHKRTAGFTLLEVLLAMFLTSILLAAVTALIVSLFMMWENSRTADTETRLTTVANWLQRRLELNPHSDNENGWQMDWPENQRASDPPSLAWVSDRREVIIPLTVNGGTWEYRLHHEPNEGLFIAWRPRNRADDTEYRYSLLSSDVVALRYAYYEPDANRWQILDRAPDPERVDNRLPQLLALDYRSGLELRTIWIALPQ